MTRKYAVRCLFILICLAIASPCSANLLKFKMVSDNTELLIGETATVSVQAWIDSDYGTAGNGLDTWALDLDVDTSGVIGITETDGEADIDLIAPDPDFMWSGWNSSSINSPVTGEAREIAVSQVSVGASSDTGIGGYSELFSFQVEALAEGTATYTIKDDGGGLFFAFLADGIWFENDIFADGGVYFDAAASDNVFTVVPEPCSLIIMSGLSLVALRRRRRLG